MQCSSANFSFRIDDGPVQKWPRGQPVRAGGLDVAVRHRIRTYCDGKPHQSFSFRYSDYKSTELCLFLNDLYFTPQLWERTPICKCSTPK